MCAYARVCVMRASVHTGQCVYVREREEKRERDVQVDRQSLEEVSRERSREVPSEEGRCARGRLSLRMGPGGRG